MDWIVVAAWALLLLNTVGILAYPYFISTNEVRDFTPRGFVIAAFIFILDVSVLGRVIGWW